MVQHDYKLIVTKLWTLLQKQRWQPRHTQVNTWPGLLESQLALTQD